MESRAKNMVDLIKNVVIEAFEDERVEINWHAISTEGANYMGELFLLDVEKEGESLKLFAKASNVPAAARKFIPVNKVYNNEVIIYTKLATEFERLQEKHEVPMDKRFVFAKYYGANLKDFEEVVVLENLTEKGYEMYDRCQSLNWEYAKAAVRELAKFHALSFALKKENPEIFEELSLQVKHHFFEDTKTTSTNLWNMARTNVGNVVKENRPRVVKFINDSGDIFKKIRPNTPYSVIVHGDYRASNLLVKYEGDKISSLIPIDYQTAAYGNPLSDLIYLLFTGTDQEFRRQYFEQFLEHYHNSLRDYLELLSCDVNDIFPKSAFYFELKDSLVYGLELGITILTTFLMKAEDKIELGDLVDENAINESFGIMKTGSLYAERINEIVNDFIKWNMLPEPETSVQNEAVIDGSEVHN